MRVPNKLTNAIRIPCECLTYEYHANAIRMGRGALVGCVYSKTFFFADACTVQRKTATRHDQYFTQAQTLWMLELCSEFSICSIRRAPSTYPACVFVSRLCVSSPCFDLRSQTASGRLLGRKKKTTIFSYLLFVNLTSSEQPEKSSKRVARFPNKAKSS